MADAHQDQSELLKMVHELEQPPAGDERPAQLLSYPSVWRYRPRINVDHFFRHFELQIESHKEMDQLFPVIRLFKKQTQVLQAMHLVPAILAGQRRLLNQLHRRLDRSAALKLSIKESSRQKECDGLLELLEDFSRAWEMIKEQLTAFACPTPLDGVVYLPHEFHNTCISEETPLAVLLPSTSGPGVCSYMLLQYLLGQHNDFMEKYCGVLRSSCHEDWYSYKTLPEVSVRCIRERHLVSCTAESLLPLVLANCNYSLTVGQTTLLEYDYGTFEKQLKGSVLECKYRVARHKDRYFEIDTMVYKVDTTSSRLLKIVREKIGQEALSLAQRRQIKRDFRGQLPAICQSIDNLNTALAFLKALGGEPSSSLHEFMTNALQMKTTILSRKAQQHVLLKHVQSLWVLLCFERAQILASDDQNAFDVECQYLKEDLTESQTKELEAMCKKMSVERLELLMLHIYECIMLRLTEPLSEDDDTNPAGQSLRDELMVSLSDFPFYEKEPAEISSGMLTADDLLTHAFPKSLLGCHAVHTWLFCRRCFVTKQQYLHGC